MLPDGGRRFADAEGSSDVHLVVCKDECTQILMARFGGQQVSSMMQTFFFCVFAAALLQKVELVMLSMQNMKFTAL